MPQQAVRTSLRQAKDKVSDLIGSLKNLRKRSRLVQNRLSCVKIAEKQHRFQLHSMEQLKSADIAMPTLTSAISSLRHNHVDTFGIISWTLRRLVCARAMAPGRDLASQSEQLHEVDEPQDASSFRHLPKRVFRRNACPARW